MTITAVYRNGVLEPITPLGYEEGSELDIEIVGERRAPADEQVPKRRKFGLGLIEYVAPDFDDTPPGFEDYM